MAQLTIAEAVKVSGRNRTTIFRAMKDGRLSYTANGSGMRRIERSELDRVFPATEARTDAGNISHSGVLSVQLAAEREKNLVLERMNEDLRRRLDASEDERRNAQAQLTALLAAPRPSTPLAADSPRSSWQRFLAWRRGR